MATIAKINKQEKTFSVPWHPALAAIVPGAKKLNGVLCLPHTQETTKLARNFSFRVPAPIMSQYDWPTSPAPYKSQKLTAAMLTMNHRAYVLSEMGTGKTRSALFAIDYMLQSRQASKALLVVPLSTMTATWDRELLTCFPHLRVGTLYGTRAKRLKVLSEDHDVYIINHDGVQSVLPALQARTDISIVVIDELAFYRNFSTDKWKAVKVLLTGRNYVWGMTGSPTPNGPTDAWAQCRLLTPNTVPSKYRYFRDATMRQMSQFTWVARPGWKDTVYEAMQPGVRYIRDNVIEIPPVMYSVAEVGMSEDQRKAYKTLFDFSRTAYKEGEVTAANEAVLISKLMQVSSGWVYTTNKNVVDLNPHRRLEALTEIIDEAEAKVIVFVSYKHSARYVLEYLEGLKSYRGKLAFVTGDTNKKQRDMIFSDFQKPGGARILVAHPQCMAHGLNLTAANVIVWYTLPMSTDIYIQACARITRAGQTRKQLVIHMVGSAVEKKVYRRLATNTSMQGALLEMFEAEKELM